MAGGVTPSCRTSRQQRRRLPPRCVAPDAAGNLYGTASQGGYYGDGAVYQVTPSGSETGPYNFTGGNDGSLPYSGVIFDRSGNLYGATTFGGSGGSGVVFELSPGNGGWSYTEIYPLPGGGWGSYERLVMDGSGNPYGTMYKGSSSGYGAVFKLTPSDGGWTTPRSTTLPMVTMGQIPTGAWSDSTGISMAQQLTVAHWLVRSAAAALSSRSRRRAVVSCRLSVNHSHNVGAEDE